MAQKRNLESLGATIEKLIVCYGRCYLVPFNGLEWAIPYAWCCRNETFCKTDGFQS